ncbi:hypothetical protein C772_00868 [Bhargavaea cecembensis DSE10]|uniref:Uncharacterized protein n=1 Tax=Bhargavaea cecembensis DSE10 TaxID=1235279 RepID=M7NF98_9BACL|nr:hypothetical protein C772_00868 [Bhargavaea cecembensis DSE10]
MGADRRNRRKWPFSFIGLGMLVVGTILNLVFGPGPFVPSIWSYLTVAIVAVLIDTVIFLYKKIKSARKSPKER